MDAVLILLCIAALMRNTVSGWFFVVPVALFRLMFDNLDGMYYYIVAGLFDLGIMILLHYVSPNSRRAYRLIWISGAWLAINLYGWIAWAFYMEPTLYNILSLIVGALAVAVVAEDRDVGMDRMVVNRTGVGTDNCARRGDHAQGGGKV